MSLDNKIHSSHAMSEWESTIVTIISTPRFGEIRSCNKCGAEHARTVAGEDMHDELYEECQGGESSPAQENGRNKMTKEDWEILIAYINFTRKDFWEFLKDETPRKEDPNARLHRIISALYQVSCEVEGPPKDCTCPVGCDCQSPPTMLSNECPIHNENPYPPQECPVHNL